MAFVDKLSRHCRTRKEPASSHATLLACIELSAAPSVSNGSSASAVITATTETARFKFVTEAESLEILSTTFEHVRNKFGKY